MSTLAAFLICATSSLVTFGILYVAGKATLRKPALVPVPVRAQRRPRRR